MSASWRAWVCAGVLCACSARAFGERRELEILCVPDDSITIDARDDDWHRIGGEDLRRAVVPSVSDKLWAPLSDDRGPWAGPDDCSMVATLAVDGGNVYVYADVRDQMLVNTATATEPYAG